MFYHFQKTLFLTKGRFFVLAFISRFALLVTGESMKPRIVFLCCGKMYVLYSLGCFLHNFKKNFKKDLQFKNI
jgi:hypothetical protein